MGSICPSRPQSKSKGKTGRVLKEGNGDVGFVLENSVDNWNL